MKLLLFRAHKRDLLSWLIKAMSRSGYSHAAVLVEDELIVRRLATRFEFIRRAGQPVICEAYFPYVHARVVGEDELENIDVFGCFQEGITTEQAGISWAEEEIANRVDYGISDLFRFLAFGRVVLGEDNDQTFKRHTICSQFAFNVYRQAGIRLLNCHDFEVRPDQLAWSPYTYPLGKLSDYLRRTGLGQVPPPSQSCAQHVGRTSTPITNKTRGAVETAEATPMAQNEAPSYQPEATAAGSSRGEQSR